MWTPFDHWLGSLRNVWYEITNLLEGARLKEADLFARLARLIAWQTCLWRSGGTSGMKVLLWGSSLWPYGVAENIT